MYVLENFMSILDPSVRAKNLEHLYVSIYALNTIRGPIKPCLFQNLIILAPDQTVGHLEMCNLPPLCVV